MIQNAVNLLSPVSVKCMRFFEGTYFYMPTNKQVSASCEVYLQLMYVVQLHMRYIVYA